ncbi:unnamed protein product [Tilletia controversa]|nr:unnamed protein product [Tilletia controversa]
MSNPTPSFQLGSGAGSRCAPSARSGLRSVSASNRPPVSSSPFAAMGSSTTNPSDSTSARNFAEISTAQDSSTGNLQRGAKRNEPDDVQGTNETLRAGHDSTQQHQLGHSSPGRQGREDDGRDRTLDQMEESMEAIMFSGNQQASKAKEEDTQASVKFDTANQSNGWKANQGTRIYGQPTPASSDTSARKKDREEHLCYHCHEPGHFKFECPRRDEDIKHVRAILATMEDNDHRNIDASVVKKVRVAMDQSSRPGSSGGDGLVRVARGTHITRDDIDEPARVVHARKAYVSSDVDNSPPLSPIHWKYGGPTITASYNAGYESDSDSD